MPRPGEDRSDVGGAAQFNNIGPVPLPRTRVQPRIAGHQPGPRGLSPRRQLMIADQVDPARVFLERRNGAGEQGKPEENAAEAVQA